MHMMISYMDLQTIMWIDGFDGNVTLWAMGSTAHSAPIRELPHILILFSFLVGRACGGEFVEFVLAAATTLSVYLLINFGQ